MNLSAQADIEPPFQVHVPHMLAVATLDSTAFALSPRTGKEVRIHLATQVCAAVNNPHLTETLS
jgi:hypothetical protein